jgi:hypothetical protein
MSQYDMQSPVLSDTRNNGATNAGEIGAFVLAEIIKFAGVYALAYLGPLSALYLSALHSGGPPLLLTVSAGISAVWGVVVFVLFILFRSGFGGIPTAVSPQDRGSPIITPGMTRGGEIGAFALAYGIVLGIIMFSNGIFLPQVYAAIGRSLAPLIWLAISIVGAGATFGLFIGFRQSMLRR